MSDDLIHIEAIRQLKARYFRAIDQHDWDLLRDVFTADVVIDTTDDAGPGTELKGRDQFIEVVSSVLGDAITVHHGHMSEIDITGADSARGTWSMEDHIWFPEPAGRSKLWGTGWYEEEYRLVDAQWKIAHMILRRQRIEIDGRQVFPAP